MASRTLPGLGLKGFWALGEDNWKDENDQNLLRLSVLVQGRFVSKVAAEPGAPAEGDIHVLNETHATHPNEIAVYDSGAWAYLAPSDGMLLWNTAAGYYEHFDTTAAVWAEFAAGGGGGGGGGLADAPSDGTIYGRKDAAWTPVPAGGGSAGASSNVFASVSFSVNAGVITVNEQNNVASVTLVATGRYLVNFTTPYTGDPASLAPLSAAWYAPFGDNSNLALNVSRNTDELGGAGVTAAGASFIASPSTFDAGEVRIVFVDLAASGGGTYPAFAGNGGKVLAVNVAEDDVEWIAQSGGGAGGGGFAAPAPARMWRLIFPIDVANYGDSWCGYAEVKFQDNVGATLSTGGTPVASTGIGGSWSAAGAFDGATTTGDNGWLSDQSAMRLQWLAYIFAADVQPYQVEIWPPYNHVNSFPTKIGVQFSTDGGFTWATTGVYNTAAPVAGTGQIIVL